MIDDEKKAVLILSDGSVFEGIGFGASKKTSGEVVFNTGMVGYPESLTDPSYHNQILTFTYPLIGNYGVPDPNLRDKWNISKYFESDYKNIIPNEDGHDYNQEKTQNLIKPFGVIVHELCKQPSHWESVMTLNDWMKKENIPGIENIDTRELTKKLRTHGVMLGILEVLEPGDEPDIDSLKEEVKNVDDPNKRHLVSEVSIKEPIKYDNNSKINVAIIDCGMKMNILRVLLANGVNCIRFPHDATVDEILKYDPTGVFVSNGPGEPQKNEKTIQTIKELIKEQNLPYMGICLGNQLFALAMGGMTFKLKFGHRSQNQPVVDLETNKCLITTQNHGYSVKIESLKDTGVKSWFVNANDKTIEGIKHEKYFAYSVQFHPEHFPGPSDAKELIFKYVNELGGRINA